MESGNIQSKVETFVRQFRSDTVRTKLSSLKQFLSIDKKLASRTQAPVRQSSIIETPSLAAATIETTGAQDNQFLPNKSTSKHICDTPNIRCDKQISPEDTVAVEDNNRCDRNVCESLAERSERTDNGCGGVTANGQARSHFREITLKENGPSRLTCRVKTKADFTPSAGFDYLLRFRDVRGALNSPQGIEIVDEIIRVAIGFVDKDVLPSALKEIGESRTLVQHKGERLCCVNGGSKRENDASDSGVKSRGSRDGGFALESAESLEAGFAWETLHSSPDAASAFVDEDSYESTGWAAQHEEVASDEDPDDSENVNEDLDRAVSELNDIQVGEPDELERDDHAPLLSAQSREHKPSLERARKFRSLDEFSLKFTRSLLNEWKNPLRRAFTRIRSEEFRANGPACDEASALIGRNRSCQSVFDRIRSDNDSEHRSEIVEEARLARTLGVSSEPLPDWELNLNECPVQSTSRCTSATVACDALDQSVHSEGDAVINNSHSTTSVDNKCQSSTLDGNCESHDNQCANQNPNEDSVASCISSGCGVATMSGNHSNGSISGVEATKVGEVNGSVPSGVRSSPFQVPAVLIGSPTSSPELSKKPRLGENIPPVNKNIPRLNENIPRLNENIPRLSENIPRLNENIPRLNENIPRLSEHIPRLCENIPRLIEKEMRPGQLNLSAETPASLSPRNKSPVTVQEWVDSLPPLPTPPRVEEELILPIVNIESDPEHDNLTLGAEATFLCGNVAASGGRAPSPSPVCSGGGHHLVNPNCEVSDAGSHDSIDSFLEARKADPETILLNLGFGGSTSAGGGSSSSYSDTGRIPQRFLTPSKLPGIAIENFLRHQQLLVHSYESGLGGYRGLTGSAQTKSCIVQKIMEKLLDYERETHYPLIPGPASDPALLASAKTAPDPPARTSQRFSAAARNVLTKIKCVPPSSVLSPDNRKWLESQGDKSPEIARRMILGQQSYTFGQDGDLIESPASSCVGENDRAGSSSLTRRPEAQHNNSSNSNNNNNRSSEQGSQHNSSTLTSSSLSSPSLAYNYTQNVPPEPQQDAHPKPPTGGGGLHRFPSSTASTSTSNLTASTGSEVDGPSCSGGGGGQSDRFYKSVLQISHLNNIRFSSMESPQVYEEDDVFSALEDSPSLSGRSGSERGGLYLNIDHRDELSKSTETIVPNDSNNGDSSEKDALNDSGCVTGDSGDLCNGEGSRLVSYSGDTGRAVSYCGEDTRAVSYSGEDTRAVSYSGEDTRAVSYCGETSNDLNQDTEANATVRQRPSIVINHCESIDFTNDSNGGAYYETNRGENGRTKDEMSDGGKETFHETGAGVNKEPVEPSQEPGESIDNLNGIPNTPNSLEQNIIVNEITRIDDNQNVLSPVAAKKDESKTVAVGSIADLVLNMIVEKPDVSGGSLSTPVGDRTPPEPPLDYRYEPVASYERMSYERCRSPYSERVEVDYLTERLADEEYKTKYGTAEQSAIVVKARDMRKIDEKDALMMEHLAMSVKRYAAKQEAKEKSAKDRTSYPSSIASEQTQLDLDRTNGKANGASDNGFAEESKKSPGGKSNGDSESRHGLAEENKQSPLLENKLGTIGFGKMNIADFVYNMIVDKSNESDAEKSCESVVDNVSESCVNNSSECIVDKRSESDVNRSNIDRSNDCSVDKLNADRVDRSIENIQTSKDCAGGTQEPDPSSYLTSNESIMSPSSRDTSIDVGEVSSERMKVPTSPRIQLDTAEASSHTSADVGEASSAMVNETNLNISGPLIRSTSGLSLRDELLECLGSRIDHEKSPDLDDLLSSIGPVGVNLEDDYDEIYESDYDDTNRKETSQKKSQLCRRKVATEEESANVPDGSESETSECSLGRFRGKNESERSTHCDCHTASSSYQQRKQHYHSSKTSSEEHPCSEICDLELLDPESCHIPVIKSIDKIISTLENVLEPLEQITDSATESEISCSYRRRAGNKVVASQHVDCLNLLILKLNQINDAQLPPVSTAEFLCLSPEGQCALQCRLLRRGLALYLSQMGEQALHEELRHCLQSEVERVTELLDQNTDVTLLSRVVLQMTSLLDHQSQLNDQIRNLTCPPPATDGASLRCCDNDAARYHGNQSVCLHSDSCYDNDAARCHGNQSVCLHSDILKRVEDLEIQVRLNSKELEEMKRKLELKFELLADL